MPEPLILDTTMTAARADAIEAGVDAAVTALQLLQAARTLNRSGAIGALPATLNAATREVDKLREQLEIIAETLRP